MVASCLTIAVGASKDKRGAGVRLAVPPEQGYGFRHTVASQGCCARGTPGGR